VPSVVQTPLQQILDLPPEQSGALLLAVEFAQQTPFGPHVKKVGPASQQQPEPPSEYGVQAAPSGLQHTSLLDPGQTRHVSSQHWMQGSTYPGLGWVVLSSLKHPIQ